MAITEITVIIAGIVLVVSPAAYVDQGGKEANAVVAMEAHSPDPSKYDVDIPPHEARFLIETKAIDRIVSDDSGRLISAPNGTSYVLLQGDVVQFGTYNDVKKTCDVPRADLHPPASNPTMKDVVHLRTLLGGPKMLDVTNRPTAMNSGGGYDYSQVDEDRVAGWLEMATGNLQPLGGSSADNHEVFRPTRTPANYFDFVIWDLKKKDVVACAAITPFSSATGNKTVVITLKSGQVYAAFSNTAIEPIEGDVVPGVDFDFELMYQLLAVGDRPVIPPIPYSVTTPKASRPKMNQDLEIIFEKLRMFYGASGVNCGPANLP